MNIATPAPTLALEISNLRPALFFNGKTWLEASELESPDKQLLASIGGMKPDPERPAAIYPTFRADFGIAGDRRVALLHQTNYGKELSAALECSGLPEPLRQLWQAQVGGASE